MKMRDSLIFLLLAEKNFSSTRHFFPINEKIRNETFKKLLCFIYNNFVKFELCRLGKRYNETISNGNPRKKFLIDENCINH